MLSSIPHTAATPPEPAGPDPAETQPETQTETATETTETGPAVSGVELESMVSHVQDLLPDLSRSFVMVRLTAGEGCGGLQHQIGAV